MQYTLSTGPKTVRKQFGFNRASRWRLQPLFVGLAVALLIAGTTHGRAHAATLRLKRAATGEAARGPQLIDNGGLEKVKNGAFPGWEPWESGYQVDGEVTHSGDFSARCENATGEEHRGLTYVVELNQKRPVPIIAECYSKAKNVSGAAGGDYSLYLDLEYMDGTPLWGQIDPCRPSTHDWQKHTVTVIPAKPIKHVSVRGIFREHKGTAWFDDFRCWELNPRQKLSLFDGTPVHTDSVLPKRTPQYLPDHIPTPVIAVRDVAADSHFLGPKQITAEHEPDGDRSYRWTDGELQLAVEWQYRGIDGALRIDGTVEDLRGTDRAVSVYCILPVDAVGWRWHDDQRTSQPIREGETYNNFTGVRAGANGMASNYPLACISGKNDGLSIASPLDMPRLCRFAYDGQFEEFYGVVDVGLSAATEKHTSSASFSFVIYRTDPAWGFRSALDTYYDLFAPCFTKRNDREGIWMPFTDIATVQRFEDFGLQFQEGAPNPAFDEKHGIYSFVYVEPVSHWLAMPEDMERTNERAIEYIHERAQAGKDQSRATLTSAIHTLYGSWQGGIAKAPWCDGAKYTLNPSPAVTADEGELTQFAHTWNRIERAFERAPQQKGAWGHFGDGYQTVTENVYSGTHAIRVSRSAGDDDAAGAKQTVGLNQKKAQPLQATVWTRADGVTGKPDSNYSLYIDLVYADGSHGWGFIVPADTGTHSWQKLHQTIDPPKPVQSLKFYLLLRGDHAGRVWFDRAMLKTADSDENLLKGGGFEPTSAEKQPAVELDGTYIDSFEMAALRRNYRREHFRHAKIPLIFDDEGRVCQLQIFNTIEFLQEVADRMHRRHKLMFANATPRRFPWPAAWLDVMGVETDWKRDGKYAPNSDAIMNYRRALCYQRPYLLLLNTEYDEFKPEWVELYFKRCTAYGIFPSFFSRNAADDPYWTRPKLYNRDRPLFKNYIPVISKLNAAGWEPITGARTNNDTVYIERFGTSAGTVYLTLFNDSDEKQTALVSVNCDKLGLEGNAGAVEVLNGRKLQLRDGNTEVEISPQDVLVLRF